MSTVAVVSVVVVGLAAIAGLTALVCVYGSGSRPRVRRQGFSGGEMLMPGGVKFGHKGARGPRPDATSNVKRLKFRNLKQLDQPSVRAGDIDFWAAKRGIESRSRALRLLVGKALSTTKRP